MDTTVKTKSTPRKNVRKEETQMADGSKVVEKTTQKRKMNGSVETKHKTKVK